MTTVALRNRAPTTRAKLQTPMLFTVAYLLAVVVLCATLGEYGVVLPSDGETLALIGP